MQKYIELFTTKEGLEQIFEAFDGLGIFVGLLLVFIESFLPFLPLIVIVILNTNAYGFFIGFLMSYLGSVLGSYSVFLVVRNFLKAPATRYINKHKTLIKMREFIDRRGFTFLFILMSLPFTPSSVVNVIAGVSNVKKRVYLYILIGAKFIMILSISIVGHDVTTFFTSPTRLILSVVFLVVLYVISKLYERYLNRKMNSN